MTRPLLAAVGIFFAAQSYAFAQGASSLVQDVARSPAAPASSGYLKKFEGTSAEFLTYIGSGSFYTSGYRNPYASLALFVRPVYSLGTRYKLSLKARLYVEEELTSPDNPNGRRFYPYDPWVWLAADDLKTFERTKVRIGGVVRVIIPLSPESRYQNMIAGVGGGPSFNRRWEFGDVTDEKRKWTLSATYAALAYKYFQTSNFRGSGPGDSTGCLAPTGAGAPGIGGGGGPTAAASDRCGGPANTNFSIGNMFMVGLGRGKWSASMTLLIQNSFRYAFPSDMYMPANGVSTGRSDITWGILAAGYKLRPHLGVSAGLSSYQPALDSRYRYPRFPFFDLSGGANANNFTQVMFSIEGSI
jgi:hypothetical protein